jgi:hypothetical protein
LDCSYVEGVADHKQAHPACLQATIAMYAGVLPAACLGALASWWRTRFFMVTVLNKFK